MNADNENIWAISSKEWSRFPSWKKDQLKQDRKVGLNRYYKLINLDHLSELSFRFDFTKPFLLPNTPLDWKLPKPYKFDIRFDIQNIINIYSSRKFIMSNWKMW